MLKPSHREKSFTAKRVFTDREDARAVFGAACDRTETRELYQVLMWYGVGGQGKSALLREFARMLASRNEAAATATAGVERRLALAKVDFDDERLKRIDSALYSLRLQLAQSCGFAFHTFDAAFVSYYRKTRPGIDVAAEFPELFMGEKEGLTNLLDVLDDHLSVVTELASVALPGANLIYKWGMRLTGRLKTWWSTRGNKVLAGIEQLTPEEILQKLPSYLGVDLCDGIAAKPSIRPVIFLDTYEALWRERGQKDALTDRRTDAWVRLLVQDAPGTLVVIAGRDKLRWSEIDPAWGEVIDAHLLGGLSAEDADRFLRAVPIVEDDIRAKIVGSSEGLPFYLDLQVTQYEAIRERGEAPAAAQFGGTPSDILSRFLEHLNDTDQSVLRLASYFNTITRPAMTHLADAFPQRAANFSFDRMVARSAFTPVADDAYTIHALMQEELQRREKDENEDLFRKIHRHLFEYYHAWLVALTEEQQRNMDVLRDAHLRFEMAFNHLMAAAPDEAVSWLLKYQSWIAGHDAWELVEKLHRRAVAMLEATRGTGDPELLLALNNLAAAVEKQNRSDEAQPVLERLIEVAGEQAAPDADLLATAHYNLAQLLRDDRKHAGQLGAKEYAAYLIEVRSHLDFHRDDEFLKRAHAEAMSLLTSDPRADAEQIISISNNQAVQELPDGNLAAAKETLKQLSESVTLGAPGDQLASIIVHHNYALSLGISGFIDDSLRAMDAVYAVLPDRLRTESAISPEMLLDQAALLGTTGEPHSTEKVLLRVLEEFKNREPLRPFSPAIALSLLSSNLSRQGRHREAVAKLFAAEHAFLIALYPKVGIEGRISERGSASPEASQSFSLGPRLCGNRPMW